MRHRSLPLLVALALAACAPAPAATSGSAADEQAIRDMAGKYQTAFNARDAKALTALMATDYEEFDAMGVHTQGRDAAEKNMTAMWPMMPAGMQMSTVTTEFVKWIDGTHAIAGGKYTMAGVPAGGPDHGAWMGVMAKQDSSWLMVSSLAGDAPPTPPAAAPAKP